MRYGLKIQWFTIFSFFLLPTWGQKQEVTVEDFLKQEIAYYDTWWDNPAMYFYFPTHHFTDVSIQFNKEQKQAYPIQQGNGQDAFVFRANSFVKKQKELYYGGAIYENNVQKGLSWNTVLNAERLQPYIVGDTIGGNMQKESYFFSGGYAKRLGKVALGTFASYKALFGYDRKDPRPHNTVSDLNVSVGGTLEFLQKYALGLQLSFNKYEQTNVLSIFRDGGSGAIFYLRGLGIDDETFTTVITDKGGTSNKYKQKRYTLGLHCYPLKNKGIVLALDFVNSNLELLQGVGLNSLDITGLTGKKGKGIVGYKFMVKEKPFHVRIYGKINQKKGKEYIYNQSKILLTTSEKYKKEEYRIGIDFLATFRHKKGSRNYGWADFSYGNSNERYLGLRTSRSEKKIQHVQFSLADNILWKFNKASLFIKLGVSYRHNLSKSLQTGSLIADTARENLVTPDFLYDTANRIETQTELRYDYLFTKEYRLYTKLNLIYAHYQQMGKNLMCSVGIGLAF